MAVTIFRAGAGAGKTEYALDTLLNALASAQDTQIMPRIWVLVATRRQEMMFQKRLNDRMPSHTPLFNVEFFNFYSLNQRVLNLLYQPVRRISEPTRLGLLRYLLQTLRNDLAVFQNIATTPGFVRNMATFIDELKQTLIEPEVFSRIAAQGTPRDRDLAAIYARYQTFFRANDLVDREGEGWLASAQVAALPDAYHALTSVDWLIVDGYDQYSPSQVRLLTTLAQHIQQVLITLTSYDDRAELIGRRFVEAEALLKREFTSVTEHVGQRTTPLRAADIEGLCRQFLGDMPQRLTQADAVLWLEAETPAHEAAAVLREVKRLLLHGVTPDAILITVRDTDLYASSLALYAREYGIPLVLQPSTRPLETPLIAAIMQLVALAPVFDRRAVMQVLASPYIRVAGLTVLEVRLLEQMAQMLPFHGGRSGWQNFLAACALPRQDGEGASVAPLLSEDAAQRLWQALDMFFTRITPPLQASARDYVQWLDALIGSDRENGDDTDAAHRAVTLLESVRALSDDDVLLDADLLVLETFKTVLGGMARFSGLLQGLGIAPEVTPWADFVAQLTVNLAAATPQDRIGYREGRVLVTTTAEARGLPHDYVFITGLSESLFPAPTRDDPIYLDSEREWLRTQGIPVKLQADRADDQGVFFELLHLARRRVTFSRPTVDNGKPWEAGYFWRLTREACDNACDAHTLTLPVGQAVPIEHAAAPEERAIALAEYADLSALPAHILRNIAIERARLTHSAAYPDYAGNLMAVEAVRQAIQLKLAHRQFSASQLKTFHYCGYYWFAKYALALEEIERPEDGIDAALMGTIYHALLESAYQPFVGQPLTIVPDNLPLALDALQAAAPRIFRQHLAGVLQSPLWKAEQQQVLLRVHTLIETDFTQPLPELRHPARTVIGLELPFEALTLERVGDPPFEVQVRGTIDRVDRVGDSLAIVDYKSGNPADYAKATRAGKDVQLWLYVLAMRRLLPDVPVSHALYWSVRRNTHIAFDPTELEQIWTDADNTTLPKRLAHFQQADFSGLPKAFVDGKCDTYCPYFRLCRNTQGATDDDF